jgi:hypothetical protein
MQNHTSNKPIKCDKGFLKPYYDITRIPENGYFLYYRRRNTPYYLFNRTLTNLGGLNSRVISYNLFLSLYFEAYINVEIYNTISVIKYVCKYVTVSSLMGPKMNARQQRHVGALGNTLGKTQVRGITPGAPRDHPGSPRITSAGTRRG